MRVMSNYTRLTKENFDNTIKGIYDTFMKVYGSIDCPELIDNGPLRNFLSQIKDSMDEEISLNFIADDFDMLDKVMNSIIVNDPLKFNKLDTQTAKEYISTLLETQSAFDILQKNVSRLLKVNDVMKNYNLAVITMYSNTIKDIVYFLDNCVVHQIAYTKEDVIQIYNIMYAPYFYDLAKYINIPTKDEQIRTALRDTTDRNEDFEHLVESIGKLLMECDYRSDFEDGLCSELRDFKKGCFTDQQREDLISYYSDIPLLDDFKNYFTFSKYVLSKYVSMMKLVKG